MLNLVQLCANHEISGWCRGRVCQPVVLAQWIITPAYAGHVDTVAREYAHPGPIAGNVPGLVEYGPVDPMAGIGRWRLVSA